MEDMLLQIEKTSALEAFQKDGGLDPIIKEVEELVQKFEHDMSTKASRGRTASLANRVAKFKVYLDNLGKDLVSDWKQRAKVVDMSRKNMREKLDCLKEMARSPLSIWEQKELERERRVQGLISEIENWGSGSDSHELSESISRLICYEIKEDDFYERKDEACTLKRLKLEELDKELEIRVAYEEREKLLEEQRLELERLREKERKRLEEEAEKARLKEAKERAEREERERKEREEILVREAEERAKREEEARQQAEIKRIEREKQAEIDALKKAEEERLAKEEAERLRVERERLEEEKRKADKEHRERVKSRIVSCMESYNSMCDLYDAILEGRIEGLEVSL